MTEKPPIIQKQKKVPKKKRKKSTRSFHDNNNGSPERAVNGDISPLPLRKNMPNKNDRFNTNIDSIHSLSSWKSDVDPGDYSNLIDSFDNINILNSRRKSRSRSSSFDSNLEKHFKTPSPVGSGVFSGLQLDVETGLFLETDERNEPLLPTDVSANGGMKETYVGRVDLEECIRKHEEISSPFNKKFGVKRYLSMGERTLKLEEEDGKKKKLNTTQKMKKRRKGSSSKRKIYGNQKYRNEKKVKVKKNEHLEPIITYHKFRKIKIGEDFKKKTMRSNDLKKKKSSLFRANKTSVLKSKENLDEPLTMRISLQNLNSNDEKEITDENVDKYEKIWNELIKNNKK